jgi:hypothetical protein
MLPRVSADFDEHVQRPSYAKQGPVATNGIWRRMTPVPAISTPIASPPDAEVRQKSDEINECGSLSTLSRM